MHQLVCGIIRSGRPNRSPYVNSWLGDSTKQRNKRRASNNLCNVTTTTSPPKAHRPDAIRRPQLTCPSQMPLEGGLITLSTCRMLAVLPHGWLQLDLIAQEGYHQKNTLYQIYFSRPKAETMQSHNQDT
jgi:hypothetical protein